MNNKKEYTALLNESKLKNDFFIDDSCLLPFYSEYRSPAGFLDGHYFFQDIFMAREIQKRKTIVHYDIGSRVDGFIAHLISANVHVNLIDIRPLDVCLDGLDFIQADATNLQGVDNESIDSISSLHAIEHFGLGRYGDLIDPWAWEKVLLSMQRVLKYNGMMYISVPVGPKNKLMFNSHRTFDMQTIIRPLTEMKLIKCSVIEDRMIRDIDISNYSNIHTDIDQSCGLFILKKIGSNK